MDTTSTGPAEASPSKSKAAAAATAAPAAAASTSAPTPASAPAAARGKVVIVDIGERQSPDAVKGLRSGKGKLIGHVEQIMADLVAAGTIGATAQPVVFVVREIAPPDDDDDD